MAEIEFVIEGDDDPIKKTFDDVIDNVKRMVDQTDKYTEKQKAIIDGVGDAYKESIGEALTAFEAMDPAIKRLNNSLSAFEQEARGIGRSQEELNRALKSGALNQGQYLKATQALNVQQAENKRRINETVSEIARLDEAERKSIGSISEKTARLTQLKKQYDELSEAQRKNANVGGVIQKEYRALSADVEKASQSLSGSSKSIGGMFSSLKGLAGAVGIAFGTAQLVAFGKELFDLAKRAEGVKLAFVRMGEGEESLDKLRAATRGTVDDLKLMTLAVDASNFKIPMDTLARGLEFAQRRAQDTGKSVDYLVESFVTGMGRKSTMILDNLGLSIIEIQEEVQKVGDFNIAVGNIIEREMARSGKAVDTLGVKTDILSTKWANFKQTISSGINTLLGGVDAKKIEDLVKNTKTVTDNWDKISNQNRKEATAEAERAVKTISDRIDVMEKEEASIRKNMSKNRDDEYRAQNARLKVIDDQKKAIAEELIAAQTRLQLIDKANNSLDLQQRLSKGIVSNVELEKQISDLRERANNWVVKDGKDQEYVNKLLKEAEGLQKTLDKRNGKANVDATKKTAQEERRLAEQREKDADRYADLMNKYADLNTSFLNKQLSNDEQEIQSVKDKYAQLERELEEYNKKTLDKKISLDKLDADREASLVAVRNKQAFEAEQKRLDEQLTLWSDYENTKKRIGEERAREMYANQLDFANTYEEQIEKQIERLSSKSVLTGQEQDQLKVLQDRLKKQQELVLKTQRDEYISALEVARTTADKRLDIERQYQERVKALGNKATAEQLAVLDNDRKQQISSITMDDIIDSKAWSDVFERIMNKTNESANKAVENLRSELKSQLDAGLIEIKDYQDALDKIKNVEVQINTTGRGFGDLKQAIKDFKEAEGMAKQDALANLAQSANSYFQGVLDIGREVNGVFDQLGIGSEKFREDLSLSLDALSSAGAAAAAFASGDIIGGITNTIKTISGVLNIFSRDRKLERSIKEKQVAVDSLNDAFQRLQRSIEDSVGESYFQNSQVAIDNLKQQKRLTEQMMKAEQSKKKADSAKVSAYKNAIQQIDDEILNIEKNISQQLTQTSFKEFSDALTNAFKTAFENGEDYIGALNNTFDDFIKNAITNSLKLKLIEPIIKQMIDTVSAYMKTNDNSLAGFSFDQWRDKLGEAGKQFTDALGTLYSNLGLETTKQVKEEGGLQGAIRREMTEATASELTGLYRSTYDLQKRSFELAQVNSSRMFSFFNQSLLNLNAIQTNTANTVSRLEEAIGQLTIVANNTSSLKEKYVI